MVACDERGDLEPSELTADTFPDVPHMERNRTTGDLKQPLVDEFVVLFSFNCTSVRCFIS